MAFKDTWVNKVDGVDEVSAEHINEVAQAVIKNEEDIKDIAEEIQALPTEDDIKDIIETNISKNDIADNESIDFVANSFGKKMDVQDTIKTIDIPEGVNEIEIKAIGGAVGFVTSVPVNVSFGNGEYDMFPDGSYYVNFGEEVGDFVINAESIYAIPVGSYRFEIEGDGLYVMGEPVIINTRGNAEIITQGNKYVEFELSSEDGTGLADVELKVDVTNNLASFVVLKINLQSLDGLFPYPVKASKIISEDESGNIIDTFDFSNVIGELPYYGWGASVKMRSFGVNFAANYIDFSKKQYVWRYVEGGNDEGADHIVSLSDKFDYERIKALKVVSGGKVKIITDRDAIVPVAYSYYQNSAIEILSAVLDELHNYAQSIIGGEQ